MIESTMTDNTEATTTAGSVTALLSDSEFVALIQKWVDDRRCPFVLADLLREKGFPAQADCAEWAAWEIDRPLWESRRKEMLGGVFPAWNYNHIHPDRTKKYFWSLIDATLFRKPDADELPSSLRNCVLLGVGQRYFISPEEALYFLLDEWAKAEAKGKPLPQPTVGIFSETK